ncbi:MULTISPECIES: bifunctional phosphoribosyl-AMP cyclohydrolase/phosphoribosyl-ATP diphosphatase HisIE [Kytococcus]|uniref:Histidine biosynthesis bifunctional protein HisIE n=1 Tax=Kytococcus schroeteri TaxID=138300 RepID=A0A2I1P9J3_9MICO|nr:MULTISPECIES: bifunctional phosphoribosyl-AMP cyclohydrolase/phosphoribosyl-ATP diphosphatase HisIE [Kytococcus]OFS14878.1 bifunctional phosphoribosyl-AMP cyclohydrolase/phosphoribosyl-ATP diphosphatase [Kytococcus sp. HMSC28H12]PKZ41261.1 bifunctional phosphoribosyl-AMP cyclohydrolase/phosphoribosyl-ATP diphosphatase HisIE [Kytococcus schroeteri]
MTVDVQVLEFSAEQTGGRALVPAVVQDADTLAVLMLGWMDRDAVEATQTTGRVTFWSRSRAEPWVKGATSGNTLELVDLRTDCDADSVLVLARPTGPTCHTGATSCFGDEPPASEVGRLARTVAARHVDLPEGSYTTSLFEGGTRRIAQKVGEEGVEVALAGVAQGSQELAQESADLLYHLLVLLQDRGVTLAQVEDVLRARRG